MYSSSKHKELLSSISDVEGSVDQAVYKEELHSDKMVKKLLDIDDHLVTLIGLLQEVKDSSKSTTQGKPLQYVDTIKGNQLHGVSVSSQGEDEDQQENYKSPEKPVYKHLYYYDVENINDGSHSKYSRLSDIAADVGASDSAPHYAMVNGTLFLGKYLINKVDTKVKVSVSPRQEGEKASIEIV
ncbi:hypothetical protein HWC09_gp081 [Lactobacillus phage 3-521]|jgi:hypothetical protein|uniref:Uncharacterized protein n=1 Tax=Lactobacillus phage 3-521 TaxID=2510943 RepID=A0A4Y5FGM8_9CAUD|nr:hypothetical protein HWC09_gp081 [Lactobacillus phage 3-521]QBJ03638.1 hypothetical protein UCC3521_0100 [Lactobacillus phage 3-521]